MIKNSIRLYDLILIIPSFDHLIFRTTASPRAKISDFNGHALNQTESAVYAT